jgi:type II secretory pathway component PulF
MVSAAARTGQLGPALDELLQHQRSVRRVFWRIWLALAYPVTIGILNFMVIFLLLYYVVPVFKQMFMEFELQLPLATRAILHLSDTAIWLVSGFGQGAVAMFLLVFVSLLFLAVSGRGGTLVQRHVIESIPLVGVLWQWSGAAGFLYLLGALLDKNVPLAEALQLTADGTSKSDLRQAGRWLSAETARGMSLAELVERSGCLPASTVPLLRWGERTNSLPEAARMLSEMFVERTQMRSDWLRTVSPPFVYILVAISTVAVLVAVYMPLIVLIQGLV